MPTAPKIVPLKPSSARPPRKTTTERGYGAEHQRQRVRLIAQRPICERCGEGWSKHLHHKDRNPFNRDDGNAEMICIPCHQREHAGS